MAIENKIIDNFLSEDEYLKIRYMMLDDWRNFAWFYTPHVADEEDNNIYFIHTFQEQKYDVESPYLHNLHTILKKLNIDDLWRVKGNLFPNQSKFIEHNTHVDYDEPHQAAIYYINTNNGYTKLEDGTKVDSVANRLLLFDGSKKHASTNCTNDKIRVNINFNYISK
jgi:hypothetical protein